MIYKFKAFFTLDKEKDNTSCYISVPALNHDFTIPQNNISRSALIRRAKEEVGLIVYLRERNNEPLPNDTLDLDVPCSFSAFLDIDSEKFAQNIVSIKEFDLS